MSCVPGLRRCAPDGRNVLQRCVESGDAWVDTGACEFWQTCVEAPGPTGDAGRCELPACDTFDIRCTMDGLLQRCPAGVFEDPIPCPAGQACDSEDQECLPAICAPGALTCDPTSSSVAACNESGTRMEALQTCSAYDVCDDGVCIPRCEKADRDRTNVGCAFYALDTNNGDLDDAKPYDVVLTNPTETTVPAMVVVEVREWPGGAWTPVGDAALAPMNVAIILLPDRHVEDTALVPGLAYRVRSDLPVAAWQINSDDSTSAGVSGGTLLLPTGVLGRSHLVLTQPSGGAGMSAGFAVVGTSDGTAVTIRSSAITVPGAGIPVLAAGDTYATTINEGDVLQIEATEGQDLTGTSIESSARVAVFAYDEIFRFPAAIGGDHFEEQLYPTETWGKTFACGRLAFGGELAVWRFLALEDATTITFDYSPGLTGLPAAGSSIVLNGGEWAEFQVDGPGTPLMPSTLDNPGDFVAVADRPVLAAHWTLEDTNMVLVPAVEQWLPRYVFDVLPFFAEQFTIVRADTATVVLDGASLIGGWGSFASAFDFYQAPIADGTHVLSASVPGGKLDAPAIAFVTGNASCGYAYVTGVRLDVLNPLR